MVIKEEQISLLEKYVENLNDVLSSDDVNDLLLAIDDAIIDTFDADSNPSSIGIELQNIYDDIYSS